ncbi:sugar-binding transcriptional regulator [Phyllobacterium salinisoli]|uniref:Sugar-binding transcriptional regulator n=1 Tax=Phyllobacterium salinisoli TaxID=1899321 RepID=A0A368K397_9HYPH|nr:sugar-binding transcriptional regulator [Phyllobacterium salinisoli]RCS23857.1 sugar-binding transcriptional regulator [Phyllobacterium salinisoli]
MERKTRQAQGPTLSMVSSNLKVKTAWLYYVEGMTQEQIAEMLGVSRVKVMRTLAACTEEGIVVTTINRQTAAQIALERALESRWGLSSAVVVPTPSSEEHLETAIGHAVAKYLGEHMVSGMTLAIGGGATLYASLKFIERRKLENASVVALVGSLPHARWINPSIVAAKVAEIYGIDSYQITAPVIVDDPRLRDALWAQPTLEEVRNNAAKANIALLTVGGLSPKATIFRHGIVSADLIKPLKAKGAVANILCHFVDAEGRLVDHPVNSQVMAIDLDIVARIPNVIIAAGGPDKIEAIRAALKVVSASVLITDSETAKALTAEAE